MDARERFKQALLKVGYADLLESGWNPFFFDDAVTRAREESGATESEARRALQAMAADYSSLTKEVTTGRHRSLRSSTRRPTGLRRTPRMTSAGASWPPWSRLKMTKVRVGSGLGWRLTLSSHRPARRLASLMYASGSTFRAGVQVGVPATCS